MRHGFSARGWELLCGGVERQKSEIDSDPRALQNELTFFKEKSKDEKGMTFFGGDQLL